MNPFVVVLLLILGSSAWAAAPITPDTSVSGTAGPASTMLGLVSLLIGPITWLVLAIGGLVSCYHFAIGNKKAVFYWIGGTVFLVVGINLAITTLGPSSGSTPGLFSMITPVFGGNNIEAATLLGSQPTGIISSLFMAGCNLCQTIIGSLFASGAIVLVGGCLILYHFYTFTVKHDTGSPIRYVLIMVGVGVLCLVPSVSITKPTNAVAAKNLLGDDTMAVFSRASGGLAPGQTATIPLFPALAFSSANAFAEYIALRSFSPSQSTNVAVYTAWSSAAAKPESMALLNLYAAVCAAGEKGELENQGEFFTSSELSDELGISPPTGSLKAYINKLGKNAKDTHAVRSGFLDAKVPARSMMPLTPGSDVRLYAVSPNAWTTAGSMEMMPGIFGKHKYYYALNPSEVREADWKNNLPYESAVDRSKWSLIQRPGIGTTGSPVWISDDFIPKNKKDPLLAIKVAKDPVGSSSPKHTLSDSTRLKLFWSCSTGESTFGVRGAQSLDFTNDLVMKDAAGNSLLTTYLMATAAAAGDNFDSGAVSYSLMDLGDAIRSKITEQETIGCENVTEPLHSQAWSCAVFGGGKTSINAENTVWTTALYRIGNRAGSTNLAAALATSVVINTSAASGAFAIDLNARKDSRFTALGSGATNIYESPGTASARDSVFSGVDEVRTSTNKGISSDLLTDGGKFRSQFYIWLSGRHIIEDLYASMTAAPAGTSNAPNTPTISFMVGLQNFVIWIFNQVLFIFSLFATAMAMLTKAVAPGLMGFCYFVMLLLYPAFALVALLPGRQKTMLDFAKACLWISLWPLGYIIGIKIMDPIFGQAMINGASASGDSSPSGMLNFCAAGIIIMTPTLTAAMMSPSFQTLSSAVNGVYGMGMKIVGGAVAVMAGAAVAAAALPVAGLAGAAAGTNALKTAAAGADGASKAAGAAGEASSTAFNTMRTANDMGRKSIDAASQMSSMVGASDLGDGMRAGNAAQAVAKDVAVQSGAPALLASGAGRVAERAGMEGLGRDLLSTSREQQGLAGQFGLGRSNNVAIGASDERRANRQADDVRSGLDTEAKGNDLKSASKLLAKDDSLKDAAKKGGLTAARELADSQGKTEEVGILDRGIEALAADSQKNPESARGIAVAADPSTLANTGAQMTASGAAQARAAASSYSRLQESAARHYAEGGRYDLAATSSMQAQSSAAQGGDFERAGQLADQATGYNRIARNESQQTGDEAGVQAANIRDMLISSGKGQAMETLASQQTGQERNQSEQKAYRAFGQAAMHAENVMADQAGVVGAAANRQDDTLDVDQKNKEQNVMMAGAATTAAANSIRGDAWSRYQALSGKPGSPEAVEAEKRIVASNQSSGESLDTVESNLLPLDPDQNSASLQQVEQMKSLLTTSKSDQAAAQMLNEDIQGPTRSVSPTQALTRGSESGARSFADGVLDIAQDYGQKANASAYTRAGLGAGVTVGTMRADLSTSSGKAEVADAYGPAAEQMVKPSTEQPARPTTATPTTTDAPPPTVSSQIPLRDSTQTPVLEPAIPDSDPVVIEDDPPEKKP